MTYFLVFLSTLWQLVVCNRWAGPGAQLFLRHVKDLYKFPQGCGRSGASTTQVNLDVKPDKQARKTFWKERGQLWILPEPQCGPGLELCLKHSSRKARLRILRLEDPKFNTGQGLLQLGLVSSVSLTWYRRTSRLLKLIFISRDYALMRVASCLLINQTPGNDIFGKHNYLYLWLSKTNPKYRCSFSPAENGSHWSKTNQGRSFCPII